MTISINLLQLGQGINKHKLNESTIIDFLDIIHHPAFLIKINVSETGLCLRLHVKAYLVGPNRYI
jgi:hypothetical protein